MMLFLFTITNIHHIFIKVVATQMDLVF